MLLVFVCCDGRRVLCNIKIVIKINDKMTVNKSTVKLILKGKHFQKMQTPGKYANI